MREYIENDFCPINGGQKLRLANLAISVSLIALVALFATETNAQTNSPVPAASDSTEVIVTARKRSETLINVPVAITAFSARTLTDYNIQKFDDYATKVPNLGFSSGSNGQGVAQSRTVSIRGLQGNNTTGFYIDDTPVPASLDPRVVDLERIEVLKGPQGTLFGAGSMGGNIRLITRKPSFAGDELKYMIQGGATDHARDADVGASLTANKVLVEDKIALRAMAFYNKDAGFTTRTYPCSDGSSDRCSSKGEGEAATYGGSLSLLAQVTERLSLTGRLIAQETELPNGFPVIYQTPPDYKLSSYTLDRAANGKDRSRDVWVLPSLTLNYAGEGFSIASSTSSFNRNTSTTEDGTEGTDKFLIDAFGFTPDSSAKIWTSRRWERRFAHETRVAFEPFHNLSGTVGVFYSNIHSGLTYDPIYIPGLGQAIGTDSDLFFQSISTNRVVDRSLFGELYYKFPGNFTLTTGLRKYWVDVSGGDANIGLLGTSASLSGYPTYKSKETGVSPKIALQYDLSPKAMIYASASKGFRPGGSGAPINEACTTEDLAAIGVTREQTSSYSSDTVWSYEVGGKTKIGGMVLTGSLFQIDWNDIQQTVFVSSCSFSFTGNSGAARNRGGELELNGRLTNNLTIRAGLGINNAKITKAGGTSPQKVGDRVFQVPNVTASLGGVYNWTGGYFLSSDISYVSDSISANGGTDSPIRRAPYALINARIGKRWGTNELALYGNNLTNAKANLGDINTNSFQQTTELQGITYQVPRTMVSRPLSIGVQYRHGF